MSVLERAGARLLVERRRLEWRAGTPIPTRSGRLRFREPHDDDELVDLKAQVTEGSLDAYTRLDLETMSPAEAAREHFVGELAAQLSPRSLWRVAVDRETGVVVGFVTPGHNH